MLYRLQILNCLVVILSLVMVSGIQAEEGQKKLSLQDPIKAKGSNGYCIECHRRVTPAIVEEWSKSSHARRRPEVACQSCHLSEKGEPDTFLHQGRFYIRSVVSTFVCGKCHKGEMRDYFTSGHAQALEVLKKMDKDDPRYPTLAGYKEDNFKQCAGCHGSEVQFLGDNRPDPETWPNSGAGRINPNRSHGTCAACHMGHQFSVSAARQPETCLRCHDGPNYPEGDIYRHSAHGVLYATQVDEEVLDRTGYFLDGKEMVSPTCAFCHFNGSGQGLLTRHNPAWRLPRDLTHPDAPLAPERAENLRKNMKSACSQCHASSIIDRFFENADKQLEQYVANTTKPQIAVYQDKLAKVDGKEREALLQEYTEFLAEAKRFRMNLYMGQHGRQQR